MSSFGDQWAAAEPDLDATLGDPFQYIPRAQPTTVAGVVDVNARSFADPDRAPADFVGRFFEAPHEKPPMGRNKPTSSAHKLSGGGPVLSLSGGVATALKLNTGDDFQVNDWVVRIKDGQTFRIEDIQPLDLGMVEFTLTRIGGPTF